MDIEEYNKKHEEFVQLLRQFKGSPAYDALLKLVNNEVVGCLGKIVYGSLFKNHEEAVTVQAEMKAWIRVVEALDLEIEKQDAALAQLNQDMKDRLDEARMLHEAHANRQMAEMARGGDYARG